VAFPSADKRFSIVDHTEQAFSKILEQRSFRFPAVSGFLHF
jgi:hypothetical protein